MEEKEILNEIRAELKYQSKLLESILDFYDSTRYKGEEKQKEMKEVINDALSSVFEHPALKNRPELEKLKKLAQLGG